MKNEMSYTLTHTHARKIQKMSNKICGTKRIINQKFVAMKSAKNSERDLLAKLLHITLTYIYTHTHMYTLRPDILLLL